TAHLARATASFGPKARAARLRRTFARTNSPSCAIAIPRRASAAASSRNATRLSAPRGSPAASDRAAAVTRESTQIPPHLSLSSSRYPAVNISHATRHYVRTSEGTTGDETMTTHNTGTREQWLTSRIELLKAEKEFTRRGDELARQRQELP